MAYTPGLLQFKFFGEDEDMPDLDEEEYRQVGSEILHAHMDPFYKECRAYGRLIETKLNGKTAAHCFGYIPVPAETEKVFNRDFKGLDWGRPSEEYDKPPTERQPFRAILKEFVPEGGPLTDKVVKRILADLKKMRKQGVYPRDIAARNYKAGLLIDFDCALTEPHFLFQIRSKYMVDHYKEGCLFNFDQMIEDEGVKTWVRALPNDDYRDKLRPRNSKGRSYKQTRPYRRKRTHRRP